MTKLIFTGIFVGLFAVTLYGQTTEFTYQGRLLDNNLPPTGNYDLRFTLWDALADGGQHGPTQTVNGVAVTTGIFTVKLDFGAQFTGAPRFLQIEVQASGGGGFTTLTPRQPITSSPLSIRSAASGMADSLSDACNLCVTDAKILSIDGAKVTGTVANATTAVNVSGVVPIGNGGTGSSTQNFVDLSTDQSNIGGNKTFTGPLNTATEYRIGGNRILSNPGFNNLFAGFSTGNANTTGTQNSFFGANSGQSNTTAGDNSFFGTGSGTSNTTGGSNSFFGALSGILNTTGANNSFFGTSSGLLNMTGRNNTIIGNSANVGSGDLSFATAIGSRSNVAASDTIVLGKVAGTYDGIARPADTIQIPGNLNLVGTLTADGSNLTNLNAGNITTGTLPIANGGTGSSTQNFVDLSSNQLNIAGNKRFVQTTTLDIASIGSLTNNSSAVFNGNATFNGGNPVQMNSLSVGNSLTADVATVSELNATNGVSGNFVDSQTNFRVAGTPVLTASPDYLLLGRGTAGGAGLNRATAIGFDTQVLQSDSIVLGTTPGFFTPYPNTRVGIGVSIPTTKLDVGGQVLIRSNVANLPAGGGLRGLLNVVQTGSGDANFYIQGANGGRGINFNVNAPNLSDAWLKISQYDGTTYKDRFAISDTGRIGIGTTNPTASLEVVDPSNTGLRVQTNTAGGNVASFGGFGEFKIDLPGIPGGRLLIWEDGTVYLNNQPAFDPAELKLSVRGKTSVAGDLIVGGRASLSGLVSIGVFGTAGGAQLCRNTQLEVSLCSSSRRYKTNIRGFDAGLGLIERLQPVSFTWKSDNSSDLGLVAEDVAEIEPLLATYNDKGEIEGVKYDRIGVIAVNAIKEQQRQIEAQQKQIGELKKLVCELKPSASICKEEK